MIFSTLTTDDVLPGASTHVTFHLLQRYTPKSDPTAIQDERATIGSGKLRVRCPRCHWQPRQQDRWSCTCGHVWNTFDTGGVCPECGITWQKTQCLRCQKWSRHDDWYVWETGQGKP